MEKNSPVTLNSVVVRNDSKFITSPIGDEIVMMSVDSGNYIGINEVSTFIWDRLSKPTAVNELIDVLLETYDIPEDDCRKKTVKHLNDMLKQDMLTIVS